MEDVNNRVVIKSNKHGLLIYLDSECSYEHLLEEIEQKFTDAAKFFNGSKMAVAFEGRYLTKEEELEIINLISRSAHIHIVCIIDKNEKLETAYENIVAHHLEIMDSRDGQFYKGTLRKGQVLETQKSIIIIGDVEPGATAVSKGNVIIIGTAKGMIQAGASGNQHAFIAALSLQTNRLKIADVSMRHLSKRPKDMLSYMNPLIVKSDGRHIYIDQLVG